MNIMYCGNSNIVDGLIISILSIVKHIKEELHIYVLTMNFNKYKVLSSDNILELENETKKINKNSFIKIIDVEEYYNKIHDILSLYIIKKIIEIYNIKYKKIFYKIYYYVSTYNFLLIHNLDFLFLQNHLYNYHSI